MSLINNIDQLQNVLEKTKDLAPKIEDLAKQVISCIKSGNKILSCGNGGSAADALHMCEEFVGRYSKERISLPAICLCADSTAITCILNDYGADKIFSRQLEGLGKKGDMLFGFTTSGNSQNVIQAFTLAKKMGIKTVLISGKDGGKAKGFCDFEIIIPSSITARIQEVHTLVLHFLLEKVDEEFSS